MNKHEQVKELAELDGWDLKTKAAVNLIEKDVEPFEWVWCRNGTYAEFDWLPDYLNSRDAIVPLISKQPMSVKEQVAKAIGCKNDYCAWIDTDPARLCEALISVVGKWKD